MTKSMWTPARQTSHSKIMGTNMELGPLGAVVAPRRFHFTITEFTVVRDSSSRTEIRRTDFSERWHPIKVPR